MNASILTSDLGRELLDELGAELNLDPSILGQLLEALQDQSGKLRRRGLSDRFDTILDDGAQEQST